MTQTVKSLAANELLSMVPQTLVDAYRPLIGGGGHSDLMPWVKAADTLDAYLKCVTEDAAGNHEFAAAERQLEAKARSLGMPEVDYFLEHFAPSFRKSLDELTAS